MVADNSLSPEKQLLKLIEEQSGGGGAANAPKPAGGPAIPMPTVKPDIFSVGVMRARAGFFKQYMERASRSWSGPIDIKKVTTLLVVLTVVSGIYFLTNTVFLAWKMSMPSNFSFKPIGEGSAASLKAAAQLKSMAYYLEKVHARDIFQMGMTTVAAPTPAAEKKKQEEITAIRAKYRIAGISWSENPDAMVENTETKKTSFVRRGQMIDNMKVTAIFKDKVILDYSGTEIELF